MISKIGDQVLGAGMWATVIYAWKAPAIPFWKPMLLAAVFFFGILISYHMVKQARQSKSSFKADPMVAEQSLLIFGSIIPVIGMIHPPERWRILRRSSDEE